MNLTPYTRSGKTSAHRSRRLGRKTLFVFAAVLLGGIATPIAMAYWSAPGSGAGAVTTGTLDSVTIDSVTFGDKLRPGGPAVDVVVHVTNTNNYAVVIDSVTAGTIHSDHSGCDASTTGVSLDLSSVSGSLPAGTSTFTAAATMDTSSVSACQGATFSAVLTTAVHK